MRLIAVLRSEESLAKAIGEAHRRYTRRINFIKGWRGHLWQGRFASYQMDDVYLMSAIRYVELNPVKARLVEKPELWKFSSAAAHVNKKEDFLVKPSLLTETICNWKEFLNVPPKEEDIKMLQKHERTGHPLGNESFLTHLEESLRRILKPKKSGRKPKKNIK